MRKHQLLALLLVFAMVASIICATFIFAEAEDDGAEMFWVTHFDSVSNEGSGAILTQAYTGGAWWLHAAFSPIAGVENAYEITAISDGITNGGKGAPLEIPEGGFVYAVNTGNDYSADGGINYVSANCNAMIARAKTWKVGDMFVINGVDLEGKTIPTSTPDLKWYDANYVCTATIATYVAPEVDPVVYNYLSALANASTDAATIKANADGSVTVTLTKDITEQTTIVTFSDDWKFDASQQHYVVADVACDNADMNFLMHYTRSDKVADLYWSSMNNTTDYGAYIPFHEGTATTWDISKYLVGKLMPDNMHQIKDLVITAGKAGDVITFYSLALVTDVSTVAPGEPLVPAVKYNYLTELANANTDAATIKANADGSVTVTLTKDITEQTTIVTFPDDWKFDATKQYYVAADVACNNVDMNFLMHYTRSDKVADLYWSSMNNTTDYGAYIPFHEGTATTWDISKYLVGKLMPDNMHQIKDLVITAGKAGDVITFNTLALVTNANIITPGEPLFPTEATNVALGKEVTVKKAAAIPQYSNANLTDGKVATTMGWGKPDDEWFSFYYNEAYADQVNVELVDGMRVGNLVINLADYYDVDSIRIHYNKDYIPQTTNIYVSTNGKTYTKIVEKATTSADGEVTGAGCWIEFPLDEVATAKYVKVEFVFSGMFAMLDEVEVYGVPAEWTPSEEGDWTLITDRTGTVQTPDVGVNGLAYAYMVDADTEYVYITLETNGAPHNVDTSLDTFDAIRVTGTAIRIYLEVGEVGKFDKLLDTVVIDGAPVAYLAKEATDAYTVTMSSVEGGTRYEYKLSVEALGIGETFKMAIAYSDKCFGANGDTYNVLNDHIYDGNADAPWSVDTHYTEYTRPMAWEPSEDANDTQVNGETGTVQDTNVGVGDLAFAYTVDADTEYVYITFETNGLPHNVDTTLDTFDAIRVTGTAIRIYLEVGEVGKFDKLLDTVVIDGAPVAYLAKEATDAYTVTMTTLENGTTRYEFKLSVEALEIGETFKMAISYSDKCFGENGNTYNVLNDHIYEKGAEPWASDVNYTEYTRPKAPVDYSALEAAIAAAEALNGEEYTEETWAALQTALEAAKAGLTSDDQDEVDALAEALEAAIDALVKADEGGESSDSSDESNDSSDEGSDSSDEGSDSSDESNDTSSDDSANAPSSDSTTTPSAGSSNSPETGDSGIVIFAILAVLSLAGAIVAVRVRH